MVMGGVGEARAMGYGRPGARALPPLLYLNSYLIRVFFVGKEGVGGVKVVHMSAFSPIPFDKCHPPVRPSRDRSRV